MLKHTDRRCFYSRKFNSKANQSRPIPSPLILRVNKTSWYISDLRSSLPFHRNYNIKKITIYYYEQTIIHHARWNDVSSYIISLNLIIIDTRGGKKKKRKSIFYRYGRRNRLFSRNCHEYLIFFALARYWRIAVAEPVLPGHGSVGSQVKLFPSLNWRPGALEMRARRLPVLWPLAFYWFNLCALSSRRYFSHRPNYLFSTSFNPSYLYSFLEIFIAPLIDSSPSFTLIIHLSDLMKNSFAVAS